MPVRLRERAQIVLLAARGMTNKVIAAELGVDPNKVGRWRARIAAEGALTVEQERPRGGNHGGKDSRIFNKLKKLHHCWKQSNV